MGSLFFVSLRSGATENMDSTKGDTNADVKEKAREVMELVETARIWYIDNGANLTFQLYGPIIGTLILAFLAYMLWQQLPGLLSSFASAMGNLAGGYGKQLKRLSGSNKWNNGGASYDEYGDYYTSGTEHYEAQQESLLGPDSRISGGHRLHSSY